MKKAMYFVSALIFMMSAATTHLSAYTTEEDLLFMEIPSVITATLNEMSSIKAPSNMTIITHEEIKAMGARDIAEVLDKTAGILVSRTNQSNVIIGIRGLQNIDRFNILFMINGHIIKDYASVQGIAKFGSVNNIQQIEIIRGPGSCLYGAEAFSGVVNIITKKPADINGGDAEYFYDGFDTNSLDLLYGKKYENGMSFELDVRRYVSNGHSNQILENDALKGTPLTEAPGELHTGFEGTSIFVDYGFKNLNISMSYNDANRPNFVGLTYFTRAAQELRNKCAYIEAKYKLPVSEVLNITSRGSYENKKMDANGYYFPKGFMLPDSMFDADSEIEYWPNGCYFKMENESELFQGDLRFDFNLSKVNRFIVGIFSEQNELKESKIKAQGHPYYLYSTYPDIVDYSDTCPILETPITRSIYGAFIQDEMDITQNIYAVLGGRYDKYNDCGETFNSRCGIVWNYWRSGYLKLLYGTAFKAPYFAELYTTKNPLVIGNKNLKPETLETWELILDHATYNNVHVKASTFVSTVRDVITLTEGMIPNMSINMGKIEVTGFELDTQYYFMPRNYVSLDYFYIDAEDDLTNAEPAYAPKQQAKAGVNLNFKEHFNWNAAVNYTSEIPRIYGDPRARIKPYIVTDTTLRYENIKDIEGFDIFASISNVFDEKGHDLSVFSRYPEDDYPKPGRNFAVGMAYKF